MPVAGIAIGCYEEQRHLSVDDRRETTCMDPLQLMVETSACLRRYKVATCRMRHVPAAGNKVVYCCICCCGHRCFLAGAVGELASGAVGNTHHLWVAQVVWGWLLWVLWQTGLLNTYGGKHPQDSADAVSRKAQGAITSH